MRSIDHVTAVPRDRPECSNDVPKQTHTVIHTNIQTNIHRPTYIHTYKVKWG